MTKIKESIVASNGSTIEKAKIDNSKKVKIDSSILIKAEKKKSFLGGFLLGVATSLTASGIVYLFRTYLLD